MDDIVILLIGLAVIFVLSGPIALIISIIALNKVRGKYPEVQKERIYEEKEQSVSVEPPPVPVFTVQEEFKKEQEQKAIEIEYDKYIKHEKREGSREIGVLEQKIGTRWILVAGIITVFVGIGFFLKYAYDNFSMGPEGRVLGVTVFGLITLLGGEITRRRGYGIVAKGVTALGFAMLYAAVFTAYQIYNLIGYIPAITAASIITIGAMIYAVTLDEVLIAFLSLLGGFATPVMVLLKVINPAPLFVYILILGCGAMVCSYYRKWKAVNLLSFAGTFILYSIWFYNSEFNSILNAGGIPGTHQIIFVLGWLGVFFSFYLVMPVLYGLVNRVKSYKQDVLLILANSVMTLYYLFVVLTDSYRHSLALSVVVLAVVFLAFSAIVYKRCKEDNNLRISLHAIGIFCATLAVPLYFKLDTTTIMWAFEAVVLVFIGMRYGSLLTQTAGIIIIGLSVGCLQMNLPMHSAKFNFILNAGFAEWVLVSAAAYCIHLLCRKNKGQNESRYGTLAQVLYGLSMMLLLAAGSMEWYYNCKYNIADNYEIDLYRGFVIILAAAIQLFVIRPIVPAGIIPKVPAFILAIVGAVYTISNFGQLHRGAFTIFLSANFLIAFLFTMGLFLAAWFTSREKDQTFKAVFSIAGIIMLWVILTMEIYLYWEYKKVDGMPIHNWRFMAQMFISIMWAIYGLVLMITGFWRNYSVLRYISFGLFGVLLIKVFLIDTQEIKNIYRVTAFLVTGITLVGVSYLYQFLKNKGFFETLFIGENEKRD